jgi:hypothetical protein
LGLRAFVNDQKRPVASKKRKLAPIWADPAEKETGV